MDGNEVTDFILQNPLTRETMSFKHDWTN